MISIHKPEKDSDLKCRVSLVIIIIIINHSITLGLNNNHY